MGRGGRGKHCAQGHSSLLVQRKKAGGGGMCFPWDGGGAGETGRVGVPWLKAGAPSPFQPFKQARVLCLHQDEGTGGHSVDALGTEGGLPPRHAR